MKLTKKQLKRLVRETTVSNLPVNLKLSMLDKGIVKVKIGDQKESEVFLKAMDSLPWVTLDILKAIYSDDAQGDFKKVKEKIESIGETYKDKEGAKDKEAAKKKIISLFKKFKSTICLKCQTQEGNNSNIKEGQNIKMKITRSQLRKLIRETAKASFPGDGHLSADEAETLAALASDARSEEQYEDENEGNGYTQDVKDALDGSTDLARGLHDLTYLLIKMVQVMLPVWDRFKGERIDLFKDLQGSELTLQTLKNHLISKEIDVSNRSAVYEYCVKFIEATLKELNSRELEFPSHGQSLVGEGGYLKRLMSLKPYRHGPPDPRKIDENIPIPAVNRRSHIEY